MEIAQMIEKYNAYRDARIGKMNAFFKGDVPFLVTQSFPQTFYDNCNDIETLVLENLKSFEDGLAIEATDAIPFMEPWIGTGVYANAFGCDYLWREGESPACHYKYHKIDEVKDLPYPDRKKSPVMNMVIETIDILVEKTNGQIPISLTDTQSPFDTCTLILDAAEFFTACYTEPEIVKDFMGKVTDLIIEFSNEQMKHIPETVIARPGHIMASSTDGKGVSISDDNLAVSSPKINEEIALPFNKKLADAFGGLAVHSCGPWAHTMGKLHQYGDIFMLDCALSLDVDPNPNDPAKVREAIQNTGTVTQVRVDADIEKAMASVKQLAAKGVRLIVQIPYNKENAQSNYDRMHGMLEEIYA